MKALPLLVTAMVALPISAEAGAQQRDLGPRITVPSHSNLFSWERKHGFHGGFGGGIFIVERNVPVIIDREVVVREVPAAQPVAAAPPAPPRKPYVIGSTYASLPPHGCMKLIEDRVSYYYCSGEWYRQMGGGRDARYWAVTRP